MSLVCDECQISCEEVPLSIKGIYYKGGPEEYVVISVLCQKCDTGEAGERAKKRIEKANPADK